MRKYLAFALASVALAATPAAAQTIDFEGGTACDSSCASFTEGGVTFSGAVGGSNLDVSNYGVQSDGQGLGVFSDTNGNYLIGDMSFTATAMTLSFGNDDQFFTVNGDLAMLQVFFNAILVGTVQVALNRDDIMNQNITYSGGAFDSFTFAYTNAAGNPFTGGGQANVGLTEVVDNITFRNGNAVPEPGTWAMMLVGFGAVGAAMRRRRKLLLQVA